MTSTPRVFFRMLGIGLVVAMGIAPPAHTQITITPAPPGAPKPIAAAAIRDADHPCVTVLVAVRLADGSIRAVCSNGEVYRIFTVQGKVVAMKCSAAAKLGVSGC